MIISVLLGVLIHLITLDVEIDASFNKAMPILEEKIPAEYHSQCKDVLRAAAFTYVIGALTILVLKISLAFDNKVEVN